MEINETVAVPAFDERTKVCPLEPHQEAPRVKSKPINVKSVADLRRSMTQGKSTRKWDASGGGPVGPADDVSAPKVPLPDSSGEPVTIRRTTPPSTEGGYPVHTDYTYPVSIAAHHLIPGEASLPKSSIKRFIWESSGVIINDVGYDVDGAENGIFLPTHQRVSFALSPKVGQESPKYIIVDDENHDVGPGYSWKNLSAIAQSAVDDPATAPELFLLQYTQQAIEKFGVQFHDSHPDYNQEVTKRLNGLDALIQKKMGFCDVCKNRAATDKPPPPYLLVHRLNNLSSLLAQLLAGPPKSNWRHFQTSKFSELAFTHPLPSWRRRGWPKPNST